VIVDVDVDAVVIVVAIVVVDVVVAIAVADVVVATVVVAIAVVGVVVATVVVDVVVATVVAIVVAGVVALIAAAGVVASTAAAGAVVIAVDAGALPVAVVLPFVAEVRQLFRGPSLLMRMSEPLASNVPDMGLPAGWSRFTRTTLQPSSNRALYIITMVCTSPFTRKNALNRSSACSAICSG